MTKICLQCGKEKDLDLFHKDAHGKLGRKSRCKDCISKNMKDWALLPGVKERKLENTRRHVRNNPESKLVYSATGRAKRKGVVCILRPEDIVIPEFCPILGIKLVPGQGRGSRKDCSPTLDRIKPELGYTKDNVAVISYRANRIKNDGTIEEHLKIVEWMKQKANQTLESNYEEVPGGFE